MSIFLKKMIFKGFLRKQLDFFAKISDPNTIRSTLFILIYAPFHSSEVFESSELENIHSGVMQ